MVLSQKMDSSTQVQILDKAYSISDSTDNLKKGMNRIILPPAIG